MEKPEVRKVISVSVYCAGVKKRCRKPDRHRFDIGEYAPEHVDVPALTREAARIVQANMKNLVQGSKILLSLAREEVEDRADGISIRRFSFGDFQRIDITAPMSRDFEAAL